MAAAQRCPACGFVTDDLPHTNCPQCGKKFLRPASFTPWLAGLVQALLVTGFMFVLHFPGQVIVSFGLVSFLLPVLAMRLRRRVAPRPLPRPSSPQSMSVILLNFAIALFGLAFLTCLLFGFVMFMNAHNAFERVHGQPYRAATFEVIRPYYQRSAGMHGPDIEVYASGTVEGKTEWMNLLPYLKRVPRDQAELDNSAPPGTTIPVYLLPNLKGQSRIQVIEALPPGEASRRTETSVLQHVPPALAILGALIFVLMRIRRSCAPSPTQSVAANF